jgi:DNA uptake protein ComE-like DNA-binding protein
MPRLNLLALATFAVLGVTALSVSVPGPSLQVPPQTLGETNKINLNTAPAEELARLPRLGSDSVSAIIEKRKTAPFKDWNDFVARRLVPSFSLKEIRDRVAF